MIKCQGCERVYSNIVRICPACGTKLREKAEKIPQYSEDFVVCEPTEQEVPATETPVVQEPISTNVASAAPNTPAEPVVPQKRVIYCSECGAPLHEGGAFCGQCGAKSKHV